MDYFQSLDDEVRSLVRRSGRLRIDELPFMTNTQVERRVERVLHRARPAQLLAIATRSSQRQHQPNDNPAEANGGPAGAAPAAAPVRAAANNGAYIDYQERNRLLEDTEGESEGEEEPKRACIICGDDGPRQTQLPCGCFFCPGCLRACIRAGLRQDGWPPRCCQPFGEAEVRMARRPGLLRLFRQVRDEQETPGDQRVYCARPACAAFIPNTGEHVQGNEMRCRACGEVTCRECKTATHPGRPCRLEDEDEELMDVMDRDGLASCPMCRRIVELSDGCNHITCVCGHNWCFLCGADWDRRNGCGCPLYDGSNRRVPMRLRNVRYRQMRDGEQPPPPPPPPPGRAPAPRAPDGPRGFPYNLVPAGFPFAIAPRHIAPQRRARREGPGLAPNPGHLFGAPRRLVPLQALLDPFDMYMEGVWREGDEEFSPAEARMVAHNLQWDLMARVERLEGEGPRSEIPVWVFNVEMRIRCTTSLLSL